MLGVQELVAAALRLAFPHQLQPSRIAERDHPQATPGALEAGNCGSLGMVRKCEMCEMCEMWLPYPYRHIVIVWPFSVLAIPGRSAQSSGEQQLRRTLLGNRCHWQRHHAEHGDVALAVGRYQRPASMFQIVST